MRPPAFTLPAGKSVTIQWQATIDPQTNQLIVNPVNTGTVSATNAPGFPDQNTNTVTTTLDTLILGGTIWNDNGAGGGIAGNGIKDGTEPGVSGVTLSLFVDANNDDVPDTPGHAARHRRPDQRQRRLLVHRPCARQLHRARRPGQFRRRRQHLARRHAGLADHRPRAADPDPDNQRRQRRQRLARHRPAGVQPRRSRSPTTPSRPTAPATTPTPRSTSASSPTSRRRPTMSGRSPAPRTRPRRRASRSRSPAPIPTRAMRSRASRSSRCPRTGSCSPSRPAASALSAGAVIPATGTGPWTAKVYFQPERRTSTARPASSTRRSTACRTARTRRRRSRSPRRSTSRATRRPPTRTPPVNVLVQANDTFENPAHAITGTTNGANGTVAVNNNGTAGDTTDDFVVYTPNARLQRHGHASPTR